MGSLGDSKVSENMRQPFWAFWVFFPLSLEGSNHTYLVGGLELEFYFSIYWDNNPN